MVLRHIKVVSKTKFPRSPLQNAGRYGVLATLLSIDLTRRVNACQALVNSGMARRIIRCRPAKKPPSVSYLLLPHA